STGQSFTVAVSNATAFEFQRANCTANNFTCLATGQIVNVHMSNLTTTGALQANEVDFDDAANTQQVTGTIVSFNGTPPTSFQMIMHNVVPSISNFSVGTPVTVTIGGNAAFLINNGTFVLPSNGTFGNNSDLLVGQEVEARVSGTFTSGQSPSFTTDRIALEPSQVTATIASTNPGNLSFLLNNLSPLFTQAPSGSIIQIQVFTASQTRFQTLPTGAFIDLTNATPPNNVFSVGGFLFNTIGSTGSPTIDAVAVAGP
ncbi:MAG: hypothetical protein ACREDR_39175, partial [Blastocatellia bacterium]